MHKNKHIGVLMGGLSAEREVSLNSGRGIAAALQERGYKVTVIDWSTQNDLATLVAQSGVEIVFNGLHGTSGEDGAVQGLLKCMGVPFTGSGVMSSAIAMDKMVSKRLFQAHGLPTAKWMIAKDDVDVMSLPFGLPCVVKPSREGSSVGVTIVRQGSALSDAIREARQYHGEVMIEEFIAGQEVCTGIVGDKVVGSGEIRTKTDFYDYEAKYQRNDNEYLFPPEIDESILSNIEKVALHAHHALKCEGYSRVDFRVRNSELFLLEINTLPGMTEHSLLPKAATLSGMDYGDLCEAILNQVVA